MQDPEPELARMEPAGWSRLLSQLLLRGSRKLCGDQQFCGLRHGCKRLIACSLRVETNAGAEDRVRNFLANVIGGATVANVNFV